MCKKLFFAFTFCFVAMVNIVASAQKNNAASISKKQAPKMDIHTAVVTGNIEAVKQHIAAGTDLNQKDPMGGSSPLMTACLFEQKAIANLLISAGADLNVKNNDGSTALHVAAFFGKTEMVKILLAKKANKSLKNNYGNTAYETVAGPFSAVKSIYEQMQQILAPMGVKLDLKYIEKIRPAIATMLK